MRNARNLRFRFLIMFLLFIPMMYALPPEGITIKGKVTDETLKEGVPGANVTVKGTSIGAITDFDGNFTIVVPNRKSVLSISFIGYVTQEIVVGDRKFITVTLKEDSQNLGEVEVPSAVAQRAILSFLSQRVEAQSLSSIQVRVPSGRL